ncbi:hypothetical protein GZH47_26665 [Paenibacillus rhizovicinus]|uniref:Phosphoribulokinase/uridine kinase domain-containing protein n=1 Tax=Paenibacillus rhizovicinus TaxID=2704463 RepID=A0A6C0PBN2_9BACL|nr:hypothetical protein [Paenibacillus rhizovicinus]QHW34022.1 hypothetical protein GZH47_26665 [Paenibacillus rhizovicinus]
MNPLSKIICICGPSGAGKSSLMERTVEVLDDSVSFYFDAYQSTLISPDPADVYQRIVTGEIADPMDVVRKEIKNDKFVADLKALRQGHEIIDPWNRKLQPAKYILVEEPFGRLREGMDELIHTVVCIDLPLEIALCRRVIRNLTYDYRIEPAESRLDYVLNYVKGFHDGEGMAIKWLQEKLKETSELILDGLHPKERLVEELVTSITNL